MECTWRSRVSQRAANGQWRGPKGDNFVTKEDAVEHTRYEHMHMFFLLRIVHEYSRRESSQYYIGGPSSGPLSRGNSRFGLWKLNVWQDLTTRNLQMSNYLRTSSISQGRNTPTGGVLVNVDVKHAYSCQSESRGIVERNHGMR